MKFYFDMDGVLADWVAGFEKLFKDKIAYSDFNDLPKNEYDDVKRIISNHPTFYYNLPMFDHAVEVMIALIENGHDVAILTSCGKENTESVANHKMKWIKKVFGGYDIEFNYVTTSKEKADFANADVVLIDDREKSAVPFEEAGGNVVLYKHGDTDLNELFEKYL